MADGGLSKAERQVQRRWSFASCVFDEGEWTLMVDGRRVAIESKPLELLRELLVHAGKLVSKDQLMDSIWPDVAVVEASLPTAIAKLRRALGDDRRDRPIIETVPRLGYRLAVPVEVTDLPADGRSSADLADAALRPADRGAGHRRRSSDHPRGATPNRRWAAIAGAVAIGAAVIAWGTDISRTRSTSGGPRSFSSRDVHAALRKVDLEAIDKMLAAGWDPNAPLDTDRNGALNVLLENCEWDTGHDQRKLLFMARTLVDGGADFTRRNAWGDTAYSIAKASRYCGPDHPVTKMIERLCAAPPHARAKACLADYKRDAAGAVIHQD